MHAIATIGRNALKIALGLILLLALAACGSTPSNIGFSGTVSVDGTSVPVNAQIHIGDAQTNCTTNCNSTIQLQVSDQTSHTLTMTNTASYKGGSKIDLTITLPANFAGAKIELCGPDGSILPVDANGNVSFYAPQVSQKTSYTLKVIVTQNNQVYYYFFVINVESGAPAATPTSSSAQPTAAAQPTANAQPTAAAAPTSAPAPSGPISFDPTNPGNNPVANDPGFPGGWGQEDRAPFDNGKEFGHTALIAFGQLYNPSMGAITTDSNIQILTFPGKSLKLSTEWEGSRWHNSDLHFSRYDEMADEQVSRAKANGGDIPRPFTYLIDGKGQIFVKKTSGGAWEQTDKLPAGVEVIDATDSNAPVVDTSASCTGVDIAFEMSKIYPDTLKGDLPLGDAQLYVYGYVLNKADPTKSTYFLVSPNVVLWIPAGNVVAKMHVCAAPNAMPAGTVIIDSSNAQLPADWTSNGFHVTPFSAKP